MRSLEISEVVVIVFQRAETSSCEGGTPECWEDLDILVAMTGNKVGDTWCGILEPDFILVKPEHGRTGETEGKMS
jgi:hypothetical protein